MSCTTPSYSSAVTVDVHIFNNDAIYTSSLAFFYEIDVTVTAIHPWTGVISGGTVLEVHGTDFLDVSTAYCKFALESGDAVVLARWMMSTRLECITPVASSAQDNVLVEVTMNDQNYSDDGFVFEYQVAAHVRYVHPSKGPKEGGTFVNVTGTDFSARSAALSYMYCRFNTSAVPAERVSSEELHCVSPEHGAGMVSVEVTLNNQQYTGDGVEYEYDDVSMASIYPVSGPVFGGTDVELRGLELHTPDSHDLYCKFGSREPVRLCMRATT
jgi:hypothetical protein